MTTTQTAAQTTSETETRTAVPASEPVTAVQGTRTGRRSSQRVRRTVLGIVSLAVVAAGAVTVLDVMGGTTEQPEQQRSGAASTSFLPSGSVHQDHLAQAPAAPEVRGFDSEPR